MTPYYRLRGNDEGEEVFIYATLATIQKHAILEFSIYFYSAQLFFIIFFQVTQRRFFALFYCYFYGSFGND